MNDKPGLGNRELEELVTKAAGHPGAMEDLAEWAHKTLQHHNNPLYHKANEWVNKARADAINKGAGKYPLPLRSDTYTFPELFEHAMSESIDLQHYLTALREKVEMLDNMLVVFEAADTTIKTITKYLDDPGAHPEIARQAIEAYSKIKNTLGVK